MPPTSETINSKRVKLCHFSHVNFVNFINASRLIKQGNDGRLFLRIKVEENLNDRTDINVHFLLDSEAAVSLLNEDDFAKLSFLKSAVVSIRNYNISTAYGTLRDVSIRGSLQSMVGGKQMNQPFYVTKGIGHNIMGWDAIKLYNMILANVEFIVDEDASKKLDKLPRHNNVVVKILGQELLNGKVVQCFSLLMFRQNKSEVTFVVTSGL